MSSFFTNPWMLAAVAAVSLPIIIEWLFRRRRRLVDLPTIRYLLMSKQQENIKRQNRILLVLRMLGIFLLVLAIARPVITYGPGGTGSRHVVVLLDGTASMQQQMGATTAFGLAQKKAAGMIRMLPAGSLVSVALMSDRPEALIEAETDLHTAAARVESLRARSGASPIADGLAWVRDYLSANEVGEPELYVFSDFQTYTWLRRGADSAEAVRLLDDLSSRFSTFLVDVGGQPDFNYMLSALRPEEWLLTAGLPVRFRVTVDSWGTPPEAGVATVTFLVDGIKKDVREVRPGTGQTSLVFRYRFAHAGEYAVEALLEGDGHRADNRRLYLCTVAEGVPVLVLDQGVEAALPAEVGGTPSMAASGGPPPFSQAAWLSRAIGPPNPPGMDRASHFAATLAHPLQIDYENLEDYAAVVLTDTTVLGETMAAKLETYVAEGGALWLFLGPRANLYAYNKYLFKDGRGLLPCRLMPRPTRENGSENRGADEPLYLRFGTSTHPALAQLTGRGSEDARVVRYVDLDVPADARVVLRLSNGAPAFVERPFGRGKVLLTNTSAGLEWTYLPLTREFPILVQSLLRYLVGNPDAGVNLNVGDRFEQPVYVSMQHLLLKHPNGRRERLTPRQRAGQDDAWMVRFDGTQNQGLYEFVDVMPEVVPRRRFAVNQTPEEGDLTRLLRADVRDAFGRSPYRWIRPDTPVEEVAATRGSASELAPGILGALILILGVESLWAIHIGRRRRRAPS